MNRISNAHLPNTWLDKSYYVYVAAELIHNIIDDQYKQGKARVLVSFFVLLFCFPIRRFG